MAQTAALQLGNLISSKISGTLSSFASGLKGSFIGANPAVFGPMVGALNKGFGSLTKQTQVQLKTQQEQTQRDAGFREEADNERKRYEQILLSVQKGMAINIEEIQKDVRQILELMKKQSESLWDKILAGLAGLGGALSAFIDEIMKSLKLFVDKIGSVIGDIIKFFKSIPERIGAAIDDIIRFLRSIPEMMGRFFEYLKNLPSRISAAVNGIIDAIKAIPEKIGKFFKEVVALFDDFVNKYFPKTRAAISKFFSDLADIFKFDNIRAFFTTQFENLKKLFNFEDTFKAIGTKLNDLIRLLDEGEIGKAFRRIRNIFAISFAQYADELEDLFNNKLMKSIGDVKTSIGGMGERIMSVIDGAVDSLRQSRLVTFGEEFGGKIMRFIDETAEAAKSTRLGTLADDVLKIGVGLYKDIGSMLKTGLGAVTPDVSDLKTFFTLGKESLNMDELKFVMGEGGVIQKGATLIGKFVGDAGRMFDDLMQLLKPVGEFLTGNSMLGKLAGMDDIAKIMGWAGKLLAKGLKAIPWLTPIITAIEGLMAAFDTEQIAADLNKQVEDVNWKDRIYALFGGMLGSLAGLGDLILMGINAAFDTNFKTEGPGSLQGRATTYFTQLFSDIGSIIGSVFTLLKGIFTLDGDTISRAFGDMGNTFTNMMIDYRDTFLSWVKTPLAKLNNAVMGWIDSVVNGTIDWMIDKLSGPFMDRMPGTASAKEFLAGLKTNYAETNKADDTPYVTGVGKDQTSAETARLGRGQKAAAEGIAREAASRKAGEDTMKRVGAKPDASAGGGRGSSPGRTADMGYTAADLKSMGINVRGYGDVQKPGAYIAGSTIEGAKKTQSLVRGVTFTGFNDDYHDQHSPKSSHTKGLAFDFTVPPSAAMDNDYRKEIAQAISSATGAKVIDEYAFPSAKSTGGHFHVDFAGSKGVNLGTGYFGGEKTQPNVNPPQPRGIGPQTPPPSREDTSPTLYERTNRETGEKYYTDERGNVPPQQTVGGVPGAAPRQVQPQYITIPKILTQDEAMYYALAIKDFDVKKKQYDEEKKYRDERAQLENQFYGDLERMIGPMVTALQGPAGSMDPALARDAGRNLARGMQEDFTRIGTALFGKQYGAAMGTTFQQLAGSYLDQFINQALAPAMGVDAEVLNRSINLYAKGKEFASKTLAPAQKALDDARAALQEKEKASGLTQASIIRASGLGKKLTPEQLSKITELETMRKGVKEQESKVDALKKQRRQYNQVALEDLFFGMTGVPTGARSLIEQYGGADALTRDLATMIGAPFSPAFHLGEKGPLAGPGVDPRIALDERLRQTEQVLVEGGQVVAVKTIEGHKDGAAIVYDRTLDAHREGAAMLSDAITNSRVNLGSVTGSSMDVFTSAIGDGVTSAIGEVLPTFMGFDEVVGGGTSIPGYVDDGSYDRAEMAKFGRQTSTMGPSSTARLPVNTGKLMDFGQNMLYNMLGSKVSSAFGGGMTGNIFGRAAQGALKGAFSGGDIVQNIGAQFGMKLAPGAGIGDLLGGVSSMFTNQITSMGSMFTNLATSKLMPGFMSQGVMDFGTGIQAAGGGLSGLTGAFGSGNLSHMAGAAAGGLMAGMQGYGISKALSGGYSTGGNTVNLLAGIGSAFFGPIAGVVGGLVNRAFGRKAKETKAQGFSGTFSTEGADVKQFTDWFQKGGWFRSNKSGTDFKAVDSETAKAFSDTVKDTTKTVEALAKSLGYDPTKTKGFSKAIKIDLKGLDEKQQQEAIQKAFKDYGASLVGASFKTVGKFTKTGEDQLDTLSRLANASQVFKSVMTGPDVKKILGLDNADTIKNLVSSQFAGVTNMDAAIKDYMAGGKGMMETVLGGIGIPKPVSGGADATIGWLQPGFMRRLIGGLTGRSYASVDSDGGMTAALPDALSTAFGNVFSKLNLDPVSDVAQNIVSAFTGSLQDQAGSLKEYLDTYVANFQSELIKAYGGEEEFQKVESSLFDLLYTEEEKRVKLQELTAAQMKEAAQELKDAGVAIDPEKLGATFADNQKAAKDMLTAADKDLASGKITKEQYATIRKSAADFLTAAKKNSELSKDGKTVSGGTSTFKAMTPEEAAKLVFPPGTLAPIQNVIVEGQANSVIAFATGSNTIATAATASANTITTATQTAVAAGTSAIATSSSESVTSIIDKITLGQTTLEQAITSGIIRVTDSSANGVQKIISEVATGKTTLTDAFASGALTISTTTSSGANTISTSATSQAQVLERLITDFINSSGTFANAVNGLNGSIGTLENAVSNFDFGGAGGSEGSGGGTGEGVGSATGIGADGTDGGAGGTGGGGAASAGAVGADGTDGGAGGSGSASGGDGDGGGDGASAWAKGGWFRRRRPMIVGEVGPEVMVPDFAGTIVPTHKIIEAVQNAAALDSQTRNLLLNAAPAPNPVSIVYMDQENTNKALMKERDTAQNVNNAVVDNSVTQVSSPQTTVINGGGDVRSTHPISGMFTRAMIGARGF